MIKKSAENFNSFVQYAMAINAIQKKLQNLTKVTKAVQNVSYTQHFKLVIKEQVQSYDLEASGTGAIFIAQSLQKITSLK